MSAISTCSQLGGPRLLFKVAGQGPLPIFMREKNDFSIGGKLEDNGGVSPFGASHLGYDFSNFIKSLLGLSN